MQKIHLLMGVLVIFKALTVLSQSGMYHLIRMHGDPEGWNVAYYFFTAVRGLLLFTVVVLIGTGWSFLKPFLNEREKQVLMIVIPLQVFANVATIVLDENGPALNGWLEWRDLFHLLDIVCCCAILFPIVWSIKHLREAAMTDGKKVRNMNKLILFRQFYVMVVAYIYFTRIIVFLLKSTAAYNLTWLADLAGELATLTFYCVTGWMFRPIVDNPYLHLNEDELELEDIEAIVEEGEVQERERRREEKTKGGERRFRGARLRGERGDDRPSARRGEETVGRARARPRRSERVSRTRDGCDTIVVSRSDLRDGGLKRRAIRRALFFY